MRKKVISFDYFILFLILMCKIKEGCFYVYLGLSKDTNNTPLDKYIIKVHIKEKKTTVIILC